MTAIVIRAREQSDAEALAAIFNCPGVVAGTLQLPYQSVEAARERIARQTGPDTYSLVAEMDPSRPRLPCTADCVTICTLFPRALGARA